MKISFLNKFAMRKQLLDFLSEMDKNLELFYVMDQRQFITEKFLLKAWEPVKEMDVIKKHESIKAYALTLAQFNGSFNAYKEFEKWYTEDITRKNIENAKKLHGLKNDLDNRLKGLDAVIIPAGQALERELLALNIIKE